MKKWLFILCICLSGKALATDLINMGYIDVNSHSLSNARCYVRSDNKKPFFQFASVFAANINGKNPNKPIIYFNPHVDTVLNHTDQINQLQQKGIKVLLSILGNHENAGWSCMTDSHAIQLFANQLVELTNKYHLDGIDIDDEYSTCIPNSTSLIKISRAIKNNPHFKGKLLTKALFNDDSYFAAEDAGNKLADFLDYGWEMSYWSSDFNYRLSPYLQYGMSKENIVLGVDSDFSYPSPDSAADFVMQNGYKGMMIYDITDDTQSYLTALSKREYGTTIEVLPQCLQ